MGVFCKRKKKVLRRNLDFARLKYNARQGPLCNTRLSSGVYQVPELSKIRTYAVGYATRVHALLEEACALSALEGVSSSMALFRSRCLRYKWRRSACRRRSALIHDSVSALHK